MCTLHLYFEDGAAIAAHLEHCLIALVQSPLFAQLEPQERGQLVVKHFALLHYFAGLPT